MRNTVDDLLRLLRTRGAGPIPEQGLSPLNHALQCAALAERDNAPSALVAAALLHDLGHLLVHQARATRTGDNFHQFVALPFLRGLMPDAVLEPIRLHVDAKRFLCRREPGYADGLSRACLASLEVQGGPFTREQAIAFEARPFAMDAVKLRRWDDLAKDPTVRTATLERYAATLRRVAVR